MSQTLNTIHNNQPDEWHEGPVGPEVLNVSLIDVLSAKRIATQALQVLTLVAAHPTEYPEDLASTVLGVLSDGLEELQQFEGVVDKISNAQSLLNYFLACVPNALRYNFRLHTAIQALEEGKIPWWIQGYIDEHYGEVNDVHRINSIIQDITDSLCALDSWRREHSQDHQPSFSTPGLVDDIGRWTFFDNEPYFIENILDGQVSPYGGKVHFAYCRIGKSPNNKLDPGMLVIFAPPLKILAGTFTTPETGTDGVYVDVGHLSTWLTPENISVSISAWPQPQPTMANIRYNIGTVKVDLPTFEFP